MQVVIRAESRMILREGIRVILPGIAAGLLVALALTRLLRGLLFGISPTDPTVFLGIAALLAAVALAAIHVTARRAGGIDPAGTLREARSPQSFPSRRR